YVFYCHASSLLSCFVFDASPPSLTYARSLHDALPICLAVDVVDIEQVRHVAPGHAGAGLLEPGHFGHGPAEPLADILAGETGPQDRKSTRLNSSHQIISYAVFCLKKKMKMQVRRMDWT